ncbi:MAG TPA: PQQ-binding-like beta-propeller repeat protein [Gaiellaceae bacterium]
MGKAIATLAGLAAAAVVSAVHASPIGTTWSQFHFNAAHTGANPQERTLGPGNVGRLAQAWSRATGAAVESSAAVSGGIVYVGSDDGRLHAYDTANGTERWVAGLEGESTLVGSPAVAGGAVLVLTSSSLVQAFDATSGAPLWSRPVSAVEGLFPGSPTVAANVVYAVVEDLAALDTRTGAVLWTRSGAGCFVCSPPVAGGVLYLGAGPAAGRRLLALDAQTGAQRWSFKPHVVGDFSWSASAAVAGGRVFIAGWATPTRTAKQKAYALYAFDAASGAKQWKLAVGKSKYLTGSSPAVARGVVYYASPGGRLYAVWAASGKVVWAKKIAVTDSSPAVANGVVYVGAGRAVYAFGVRNGKKLWSARAAAAMSSSPAVVDGSLYVSSSDGVVHAYRLP